MGLWHTKELEGSPGSGQPVGHSTGPRPAPRCVEREEADTSRSRKRGGNRDGFSVLLQALLSKARWHAEFFQQEEKKSGNKACSGLGGPNGFLTVATQQIHFQTKVKAVNGDEIPAGCLHSPGGM